MTEDLKDRISYPYTDCQSKPISGNDSQNDWIHNKNNRRTLRIETQKYQMLNIIFQRLL